MGSSLIVIKRSGTKSANTFTLCKEYRTKMLSSVVLIALVGSLQAQQASYGAPSTGYASPDYAEPQAGYGASAGGSYDYGNYDSGFVATQEDGGLDLSKLGELIPLFLVVFAAIILAQMFSPLLTGILALFTGILPMALGVKAPIINALLQPFGLQLCDLNGDPFPMQRSLEVISESARSMGFDVSDDQVAIITDFAERLADAATSYFQ